VIVTVDRPGTPQGRIKARIEEVGEEAGRLAAAHLGGRMPQVRVLVSDRMGMVRAFVRSTLDLVEADSFKRRSVDTVKMWRGSHNTLGVTVPDRRGALVVINGVPHGTDRAKLDATLIHELGHTVQVGSPQARARYRTYVRQQLGLEPFDEDVVGSYLRLMQIHEQQAANLEVLARRLGRGRRGTAA